MKQLDTARLIALAEQKHHLLTQLRELSIDQNPLADQRRADELLALLSRKSEIIESLLAVQEQLKPFQAQEPEQRSWSSETERTHCRALFLESEKLIAEILVIDDRTLGEMTLQRDFIGQQLNQFASAEAIHDAYSGASEHSELSSTPILSLDG